MVLVFDQLLIVEPPYDPDLDFHYRIFNADGSEVSQCGNGARCFARFVTLKGLTNKKDIAVSTQKGKMVLTVKEDGQIRVNMGEPIWEPNKIPFTANKFEKKLYSANRCSNGALWCGINGQSTLRCSSG